MLVCQSKSRQVGLNTEEIKDRIRGSTSAKGVIWPTFGKETIDYLTYDAVNTKTDQQGFLLSQQSYITEDTAPNIADGHYPSTG